MIRRAASALFVFAAGLAAAAIDPGRIVADVKHLASPELRGRGTGSPELEKAAQYIARQFQAAGLKPLDGRNWFQPFNVTTNARLGGGNRLVWTSGAANDTAHKTDFIPFNFSSKGKVSAGVVFAGYGITAPEYGYDDYAGLDVKDKVVVVLRHEPQEYEETSVFSGKAYTTHAQFASKAVNAKLHGARGVILVGDRAHHAGESDELEVFGRTAGPGDAGILFLQVKTAVAEKWLGAHGVDLEETQKQIDQDLKPRSRALPATVRVEAAVDVERAQKTVNNVAGYLPGQIDEYLVIGAHYDHLGLGEQFSMAPSMAGTIHPGADDNASGTAGILELARYFAGKKDRKRGVVFLAFAGEELGLLGSSHYVNNPNLPLNKAVAMINLDMIGRVRDGKVYVGGVGTGSTLRPLLEELKPKHKLNLDFSENSGYGSSDHTSFTTKEVPVLFFFSGLHGDYHKPSDTWDKIDGPSTAALLTFVAETSERLLESGERPLFVRVKDPNPHGGGSHASGTSGGGGGGYGPYFGSIPDFAEPPKGVRFADVRDDSPAAKAGLKKGDIMIEFDGKAIANLYDFTYALRTKTPGDVVVVKVLRNDAPVAVNVTLEKRR